jgi:endonuclease-8
VPEGNTVWLTARSLHEALAGKTLVDADLRVPSLATVDLRGRRVIEVVPRGKHILIRLAAATQDAVATTRDAVAAAPLTLHSHLRMDGAWRVEPARTSGLGARRPVGRDDVRVVLTTPEVVALGRRVHDLALVPTAREVELVGHLGPDLLGPDWDAAEAVRRLRRRPERPIGPALLDQRNLAGAGNVYKNEICFLRGVAPSTPVGDVRDLPALVATLQRLLAANRERYAHVTTGDPRPGHQVWVYGRAGRPCRRCRTPIESARQVDESAGETADADPQARVSWWCPHCQPG